MGGEEIVGGGHMTPIGGAAHVTASFPCSQIG